MHLKENDSSYFAKVRHTFGLLGIAFGTVSSVGKRVRAIKVRSKILKFLTQKVLEKYSIQK